MAACPVPVILHICGDTTHLLENMLAAGAAGISLNAMINFGEIKDTVPEDIVIMGNLDPVNVIAYAEKSIAEKNIRQLLQVMKG